MCLILLKKTINFAYKLDNYLTYQNNLLINLNNGYTQYYQKRLLFLPIIDKQIIY